MPKFGPKPISFFAFCVLGFASWGHCEEKLQIRMPENPAVSPDGNRIAFSWAGEVWTADVDGKNVQRMTHHAGSDRQPLFSPDGTKIAFISDRTGSSQIFLMSAEGSVPRQISFHSEGYALADWFPDGKSVLAIGSRDHFHRDSSRLIQVNVESRRAEKILANAMTEDAKLSPDGKKVLFTREGERWWRKGYEGERSAQVWLLNLKSGEYQELLHEGVECMWPTWMADGKGFYFTKGTVHGFDLWKYRFSKNRKKPGKQSKVYGFEDDSIVYPALSRNGERLVFRHLFDLYAMSPAKDRQPKKIELEIESDLEMPSDEMRREFDDADEVAFSDDGLDIAIVAAGDVWVMDSKLREPKQVTATAGYETDITFSPDGRELWFTSTTDGQVDIWKATRKNSDEFWWQNSEFVLEQVTEDSHVESDLRFTATGNQLVLQQGRGDLVVMDLEGEKRKLVSGFSGIGFDLSADGRWIAYSQQDNDFNYEIWIAALDGSSKPVNVSRHPDNDRNPRFSPDGKLLAFSGRRIDREVDIYFVYLQEADEDETSRERTIEEAIELMQKKRKTAASQSSKTSSKAKPEDEQSKAEGKSSDSGKSEESQAKEDSSAGEEIEPIRIDFERIHERLHRVSIPDSYEGGLLFSPDSKKLAFSASVDGKSGWYTIEFPDNLKPKFLTDSTGSEAVWTKAAGGILYNRRGTPAKYVPGGKLESFGFEVAHTTSRSAWLQAGFEKAWLTMREAWYDDRFANHNWDEIRRKYAPIAAQMHDTHGLGQVVQLMLGELNGSHLGFYPSGSSDRAPVEGWQDSTAHLGVRFQKDFRGPGLLVRDVILDGPADRAPNKLMVDDVVTAIDGTAVDPGLDLTQVLNGRLDRDIRLHVRRQSADEEQELEISVRPISFSRARQLLYQSWLEHNRKSVEEASDGKLGYLHIRAMDMNSFYEFERQLYNVGYGREGLVIDVRDNGGGSTTDLLLTALTQPRHAITVPRGGGQGYPHDRSVFATWSKPIIVLCNQNSYSNAEIFSHAIKTLGRGQVVGVQTAGGVISTGSAGVNDVGRLRIPFRGWFLVGDGQDMERNGCLPDVVLWPTPGELPTGTDRQLDKAVELLLEEVGEGALPQALKYAAERDLEE